MRNSRGLVSNLRSRFSCCSPRILAAKSRTEAQEPALDRERSELAREDTESALLLCLVTRLAGCGGGAWAWYISARSAAEIGNGDFQTLIPSHVFVY